MREAAATPLYHRHNATGARTESLRKLLTDDGCLKKLGVYIFSIWISPPSEFHEDALGFDVGRLIPACVEIEAGLHWERIRSNNEAASTAGVFLSLSHQLDDRTNKLLCSRGNAKGLPGGKHRT